MNQTDALLREVTRLYLQAQRETIACCDVKSQTQCLVLTEVGRSQPVTALELGEKLGFEKSWMSRVITQLVEEGLLEKAPNHADGRSSLLSLTGVGQARVHQLNFSLNNHAENLLSAIPSTERENVLRALHLLRDALEGECHPEHCQCL